MTDKKDNEPRDEKNESEQEGPLIEVADLNDLPEPISQEIGEWEDVILNQLKLTSDKPEWDKLCRILALYKYQIESTFEIIASHKERLEALADGVMKTSANIRNLVQQLNVKWDELGDVEKDDDWWKR